jgi:hypothetical protein
MKKPGLVTILCAVLALLSCDPKYYTVTVENQSSKAVTYTYNGVQTTLVKGGSKEYQVEAFTLSPGDISVEKAMSVEMESHGSGERYVFKDRKSLVLEVENKLGQDIYLTADKYIETAASPPATELQFKVSPSSTGTAKIYTETPRFTVLATPSALFYPAPSVSWEIKDSVMKVVISGK